MTVGPNIDQKPVQVSYLEAWHRWRFWHAATTETGVLIKSDGIGSNDMFIYSQGFSEGSQARGHSFPSHWWDFEHFGDVRLAKQFPISSK